MIAIALYVVCKFVICDIPNSLIEQNKMLKSDGSDLDSVLSETDDIKGSLSRMDKSKSTSPSRKTSVLFMFIFWSIIIAIVSLYTQRTITRNLDWKTDEALFYSSLDVCPRSAKLHLQLAKLTINKHDFINASRHIKLAKEIDPDFCDIWYQEALLHIMYYNDVDAAVGKLAQSLRCVFTNTGSWTLLSQIWSEQMERNPNDYKLMENIGHIALDAGKLFNNFSILASLLYLTAIYRNDKYGGETILPSKFKGIQSKEIVRRLEYNHQRRTCVDKLYGT